MVSNWTMKSRNSKDAVLCASSTWPLHVLDTTLELGPPLIGSFCLEPGNSLDSSLKRHTALIKRMRQSMGAENRDQIIRDLDSLALEKYIEEIVSASAEGCLRCKSDKDAWAAVEVRMTILISYTS